LLSVNCWSRYGTGMQNALAMYVLSNWINHDFIIMT